MEMLLSQIRSAYLLVMSDRSNPLRTAVCNLMELDLSRAEVCHLSERLAIVRGTLNPEIGSVVKLEVNSKFWRPRHILSRVLDVKSCENGEFELALTIEKSC